MRTLGAALVVVCLFSAPPAGASAPTGGKPKPLTCGGDEPAAAPRGNPAARHAAQRGLAYLSRASGRVLYSPACATRSSSSRR
jgi:hypothetical protein